MKKEGAEQIGTTAQASEFAINIASVGRDIVGREVA